MTTKAESEEIQGLIFGYLSAMADPTAVKMKDIRQYLENKMQLPEGSFKEGNYRQLLEVFASQFYSQQQSIFANPSVTSIPPNASTTASSTGTSAAAKNTITLIASSADATTSSKKSTKKTETAPVPPPPQLTIPPLTSTNSTTGVTTSSSSGAVAANNNDKEGVTGKKRNRKVDAVVIEPASAARMLPAPASTTASSSSSTTTSKTTIAAPTAASSSSSQNREAALAVEEAAINALNAEFEVEKRGRKKATTTTSSSESKPAASTLWTGSNGTEIKKGKFSSSESAIVRDEMETYVAQKGMELNQLSPYFFDKSDPENTKKKRHSEIWSRIAQLLPHRSPTAIYQHAMRLILNEDVIRGPFTEQEKVQLDQLVELHGRNFVLIGKEMGRRPDDCKQMLIKLQRKKTGRYSLEEDQQIFAAIRKTTNILAGLLPQQLEIPWTAVANLLDNQRTALDYHRRFLTVAHLHYEKNYPEGDLLHISDATVRIVLDPKTNVEQHTLFVRTNDQELTRHRIRLLEYLQELGAEDETEFNWAEVDRVLNFYNNASSSRWKLMLRECPLNSHEVSNFQDKVSFLLEFYREALSSGRSLRASSGRKRKFDSSVEFPPVPSNADIFGDSGDDDSEEEQLLEEGAAALSSNRATSVPTSQTSLAGLFVNPIILQQQQVTEEERIQEQLKHPKKRKLVENREAVESRSQAAAPSAQVESITVETSRSSIKEDVIDEEEEQVDQDEVDNTSQPKKHKKHKEHKHDKKEKKSKKDKKDKKHKKDKDRHHDEA